MTASGSRARVCAESIAVVTPESTIAVGPSTRCMIKSGWMRCRSDRDNAASGVERVMTTTPCGVGRGEPQTDMTAPGVAHPVDGFPDRELIENLRRRARAVAEAVPAAWGRHCRRAQGR